MKVGGYISSEGVRRTVHVKWNSASIHVLKSANGTAEATTSCYALSVESSLMLYSQENWETIEVRTRYGSQRMKKRAISYEIKAHLPQKPSSQLRIWQHRRWKKPDTEEMSLQR